MTPGALNATDVRYPAYLRERLAAAAPPQLATRRNQFVTALADEVWFAHIAPGGQTARLAKTISSWPPGSTP